jgi:hypothetical protein
MSTTTQCRWCGTVVPGSYPLCDAYECGHKDNAAEAAAEAAADAEESYKIVRFCQDDNDPRHREVILTGLTLEEAQAHCSREDTHGDGWFDGYTEES